MSASAATADGAALFSAKGCAACHRSLSSGPGIGDFPPLVDVASWADSRRPGMDAREYLAESMRAPAAFLSPAWDDSGATAMPDLKLTQEEIDALVDYLLQS